MEIIFYCLYFYITGYIALFLLFILRNKVGLIYDYKDCKNSVYKEWFIDYDNTREIYSLKEALQVSWFSWVGIVIILISLLFDNVVYSKYTYKFKNWFENKGE